MAEHHVACEFLSRRADPRGGTHVEHMYHRQMRVGPSKMLFHMYMAIAVAIAHHPLNGR